MRGPVAHPLSLAALEPWSPAARARTVARAGSIQPPAGRCAIAAAVISRAPATSTREPALSRPRTRHDHPAGHHGTRLGRADRFHDDRSTQSPGGPPGCRSSSGPRGPSNREAEGPIPTVRVLRPNVSMSPARGRGHGDAGPDDTRKATNRSRACGPEWVSTVWAGSAATSCAPLSNAASRGSRSSRSTTWRRRRPSPTCCATTPPTARLRPSRRLCSPVPAWPAPRAGP
jgi:hypothetical protein